MFQSPPDVRLNNLLAIGHSKSFQTISSTDLHSCLHLGDTFFCKGRKVMETCLKKSCLGSLYLTNAEVIQITCKFKVAEDSERIFELAENTWLVYSTGTINTNQVCQAKNTMQTHQINSGDMVTVKPGCYIGTMDDIISADESKMIEIQKKTMDWTENWLNSSAGPTLRASTLPFKASGQSKTESSMLVNYSKNSTKIQPAEMHWTFTSPAAMIGIALAILLIGGAFQQTAPTGTNILIPQVIPRQASSPPRFSCRHHTSGPTHYLPIPTYL